jgi:uncharacterized protein YqjF (DUF2071 family)
MREPADCVDQIGTGEYYNLRFQDFSRRHQLLAPPNYYLEYGLKYFRRFQALSEKLTEAGKGWVVRTARLLQEAIEARRKEDPTEFDVLEQESAAFQDFAYGTHPTAYLEGGLAGLPPEDILLIVNAPDAKDLLTNEGIKQVVETALTAVAQNGPTRNVQFVEEAVVELSQYLKRRTGEAIDAFDRDVERKSDAAIDVVSLATDTAINAVAAGKRKVDRIVAQVTHAPVVPWVMHQTWQNPLFCSWKVEPKYLRPLVPEKLDLDLHEGSAWVSMVPLQMARVGMVEPTKLPALETFPEVNLRTYVRHKHAPGVYFLSLECGQTMVDFVASLFMHLPYQRAHVSIEPDGDGFRCQSRRDAAVLDCSYSPSGKPKTAKDGSIEQFLTERYAMFVVDPLTKVLLRGDVRHERWKVQPATVKFKENTIFPSLGVPIKAEPDHIGFSPGVGTKTFPFVVAE